ncbi:MAG TPA: response regulator transcription factor [Thermoanaerobaculia bacterium]
MEPRVLIADDHPPIRTAVRAVLEEYGFAVCAEAGDAQSAVDAALRERPDACVMDIYMPGGGIRAAAEISAKLPDTAILILTFSRSDEDFLAALRAGASGYLLKDVAPERLPEALRSVLRGEAVIHDSLVTRLIEEVRPPRRGRVHVVDRVGADLTPRESEVLELLKQEKTTGEIAYVLSISEVTVRRHISGVVKKLRVRNRKEALRVVGARSGRSDN